jgi:hypothetical protein
MTNWLPIPGYDGLYDVSDEGAVRSWTKIKQGGLMTLITANHGGYLMVKLKEPDGNSRTVTVHSLVARAFIGPRPDGALVRHLDDSPTNNRVGNLAYGTLSDNGLDAVGNGRNHQAAKTHCVKGHPLSGGNLYIRPQGGRACQKCRDDAAARYRARKAESRRRVTTPPRVVLPLA